MWSSQNTPEAWSETEVELNRDAEFQAVSATSQSALQFAAISENEKSALRSELQTYLTDLTHRTGSDGQLLVHVPTNFDEVANAMDRDDLESAEPAPWSKYLLSRDVTYDASLEDGPASSRYRDLNAGEDLAAVRLEEAMARVKLLDSKLKAVHRKDLQLRHDLSSRSVRDGSEADSEAPTSGRQSARSIASSRMNDHTFLTRARSDKGSTSAHSAMSSPQMSARTDASHADSPSDAHLAPEEHKACSPVQQERKQPRVDAVERNIQALAEGRATAKVLTDEEELRLRYLLDVPEESQEWMDLSRFGVSREQEEQIRELDTRLEEEYGRTHRYASAGTAEVAPAAVTDNRPDYLAQLRADREQGQAAKYIDGLLKASRGPADLSGIVDMVSMAQQEGDAEGDALQDVPCFAEVPANRKVTSKDITVLLSSVRQMLVPAAEARSHQQQQQEDSQLNEDEGDREEEAEANPFSAALEPVMLAPRRDIDRLLAGVQMDVRRLSELRAQLGGLMDAAQAQGGLREVADGAGALGKENGRHNNFTESKRTKEIMKDLDAEVEDLYLRYGKPSAASPASDEPPVIRFPAEAMAQRAANVPVLEPLVNVAEFRHKLNSLKQRSGSKGLAVNGLGAPVSAAQASIGAGLRLRMLRNNLSAEAQVDIAGAAGEEEEEGEVLPLPPQPRHQAAMPQKLII